MHQYKIIKYENSPLGGTIAMVLDQDGFFVVASNNVKYFENPKEASMAWHIKYAVKHYIRRSDSVFIVGRRGGHYKISNGNLCR